MKPGHPSSRSASAHGYEEGDFDVEQQEDHRDQVELDRLPFARIADGRHAAFVGREFFRSGIAGAEEIRSSTETMPKPTPMTPNRRIPPQPYHVRVRKIMPRAPDFRALVKDITRTIAASRRPAGVTRRALGLTSCPFFFPSRPGGDRFPRSLADLILASRMRRAIPPDAAIRSWRGEVIPPAARVRDPPSVRDPSRPSELSSSSSMRSCKRASASISPSPASPMNLHDYNGASRDKGAEVPWMPRIGAKTVVRSVGECN